MTTLPSIPGDRLDVRVSDAERTAVTDRLAAHAPAGRPSVEELGQRAARAHSAVVRRDLDPLLSDPPEPPRRRAPPAALAPALPLALAAALAATVALGVVAGHPVPPVFLLVLLVWRRFA